MSGADFDLFAALLTFAFVTSVTPGPNNLMLMTSGMNFGLRRTLPHLFGISIGFGVMVLLIGAGLGALFLHYPVIDIVLKILGSLYLLFLAWKIAHSGPVGEACSNGEPLTFMQAAAFQWVNPKAWMMATTATAGYKLAVEPFTNAMIVAFTFSAMNFPCVGIWAWLGVALRRLLERPAVLRMFNITMALLLAASLWPIMENLFFTRN